MFKILKRKTMFGPMVEFLKDHINQFQEKQDSIPEDIFDVTKFSLEEILGVFKSMDTLMKENDIEGCIKLSRSILENSINLQYIYKEETEKRAKNFKLTSIKKLTEKFKDLDEYPPEAKEMNDFFLDKLKEYTPEKNMREKFKAVNSDHMYMRSYKRLSEYIHPVYRLKKVDFNELRPHASEMKRTVESDTCLVTLMVLEKVCTKYDLDGGIMRIDDPGYKGIVFFATNPKKEEAKMKGLLK